MTRRTDVWLAAAVLASTGAALPQAATAAASASAVTIRVPADRSTITQALASARSGDTILVSPGTYNENIDFEGKAVKLVSTHGPAHTIIDGGQRREVVFMNQHEPRSTQVKGFTIRNGHAAGAGGGIVISGASPTIINNRIVDNSGCGTGIGMFVSHSSALIKNNLISRNRFSAECTGGAGIGIAIGGGSEHPIFSGGAERLEVIGNRITHNSAVLANSGTSGGGLSINFGPGFLVSGNYIANNHAQEGGGVDLVNDMGRALLIQNVIVRNKADEEGGGISHKGVVEPYRPAFIANTITENSAPRASGLLLDRWVDDLALIGNNITVKTGAAVVCRQGRGERPPVFTKNNLYAAGRSPVGAGCPALSTGVGNTSQLPRFVAPGSDYRLQPSSPLLDRGAPAGSLPVRDVAGRPRAIDGDGDGEAVPDMGAYEFQR